MTHDPGSLHDPDRLDRAARGLVDRGAWRAAVALVERYAREATPRANTWLHEAVAFYHLGLMDRCASRLQQAAGDGVDARAHALWTARMLLARGWRARAAQGLDAWLLEQPDDADAQALRAQADAPAARAPQVDPEEGTSAMGLLDAARQCLHAGAFLRGRRLLERALALSGAPTASPEAGGARDQALDLLWALDTDLARPGSAGQALLDAEAWIALDGQRGALWPHGEAAAAPAAHGVTAPIVFPELFDAIDDPDDPETPATSDTEPTVPNGGVPAPVPSPFLDETRIQTVLVTRAEVASHLAAAVAVAEVDWEDEAVVALSGDAVDAPPPTTVLPADAALLGDAPEPTPRRAVGRASSLPADAIDDPSPPSPEPPGGSETPASPPSPETPGLSAAWTVVALIVGLALLAISFFVSP